MVSKLPITAAVGWHTEVLHVLVGEECQCSLLSIA